MKSTTNVSVSHRRLVRLVNSSPLITYETRFITEQKDEEIIRKPTMIFVSPQEHKSVAVPEASFKDFLLALRMLAHDAATHDATKGPSGGMLNVSMNDVNVKINMTGIWVGFGRRSMFKVYDTKMRYGKPIDAYCSPEVAANRYKTGFKDATYNLNLLIDYVEEFLRVINYWKLEGDFLDAHYINEFAGDRAVFRYVGPKKGGTGSTNLAIISEYSPGAGVKTNMCSSNTILSLVDDRKLITGSSYTATEWFFISVLRALRVFQNAINDSDFKPRRIELFKDVPEVIYEDQKIYNAYIALVPSPRGLRVVINHDALPAHGKLSWVLKEMDLDKVIDAFETLVNFYPIKQG